MIDAATTQGAPSLFEAILVLLATDVLLVSAGAALFHSWRRNLTTPPPWVVALSGIVALAVYLLVTRYLWIATDDRIVEGATVIVPETLGKVVGPGGSDRGGNLLLVLLLCLGFWTIPVGYYSEMFVRSWAVRSVDKRSIFGVRIPWLVPEEDPEPLDVSEFVEARALAQNGDIDGAVAMYRSYTFKRAYALLAAARLLEADGRYEDACTVLREIADRETGHKRAWAEAMFRLGILAENQFGRRGEAMDYFALALAEAGETEHGRLAQIQLNRIRPGGDELLERLDRQFERQEGTAAYATAEPREVDIDPLDADEDVGDGPVNPS